MKQNKKLKSIIAGVLSTITIMSMSTVALAATPSYVNSVGSQEGDIAVVGNSAYTVVGKDTTQNKKSEYTNITYADEKIVSKCDVYATVAEGSDVYNPSNPDADENGFVNGDIVVSMPVVLVMSGTVDNNGNYVAKGMGKVKGNIAGTTVINVVPDSSFKMSQIGKDDITATVTQNYKKFAIPTSTAIGSDVLKTVTPSFNDDCTFAINVSTNEATAGSWSGSYNNNIFLSTVE